MLYVQEQCVTIPEVYLFRARHVLLDKCQFLRFGLIMQRQAANLISLYSCLRYLFYISEQVWEKGKRQVQHMLFNAFIFLQQVQWAHSLEPLQAKKTNCSIKDKPAAQQLCFAYMVLGLTPLVGKRGLLCPRKPPWDLLQGTIPVIRYEQGHQMEKVLY